MKKMTCLLVAALAGLVSPPLLADDQEVDIMVTPNILIPNSAPGQSSGKGPAQAANLVTVHVDFPLEEIDLEMPVTLSIVEGETVVEQLEAEKVFADDCGNLVAKFDAQAIEDEESEFHRINLLFQASKANGEGTIFGTDEVRVWGPAQSTRRD